MLELAALQSARTGAPSSLPLISVIVPVYNVAKTLERSVKSITAQTYTNLEILLIDDGATDGSEQLCDQIAARDQRIEVIHQDNQGLSGARNTGIAAAKGEYLTFVDSDDEISEDMLACLYRVVLEQNVALAICSFEEVFPQGKRKNFAADFANLESDHPALWLFSTEECLTAMLCENGFTMSAWGKLYHASLFKTVRFPLGKLYEDVGTTYKLVLACDRIAFLALPKYFYTQNADSITGQAFSMRKLDLIDLTDEMCDELDRYYLSLDNLTKKRRMHARFSVLRQMKLPHNLSTKSPEAAKNFKRDFYKIRRNIINYLRKHKDYILKNPLATKRDRIAMRTILLGRPIFSLAWQVYEHKNKR